MKKIITTLLCIILILGVSGCTKSPPGPLDDLDKELAEKLSGSIELGKDDVIEIKAGQIVYTTRSETQSVPYRWHYKISDENLMKMIQGVVWRGEKSNDMPGGGGEMHTYYFEALQAGECTIYFYNMRIEEEPDEDSIPDIIYTVRISD